MDWWHRYKSYTGEHSRNECSVHFESSILVSIITGTTLAACTLVLLVIIRTSVSKGGKSVGVRKKNKRQVGTRATIPYLISGVARFSALSSLCCLQFISPFVSKQKIILTGLRVSTIVVVCQLSVLVYGVDVRRLSWMPEMLGK